MDKCEWEDGKFYACDEGSSRRSSLAGDSIKVQVEENRLCFNYCPFCGADIRKPKPEVIIKKSGDTWVARANGVDYLWMHKNPIKINYYDKLNFELDLQAKLWKPISEMEITDNIAKLRPKILHHYQDKHFILKLYGVVHNTILSTYGEHNNESWKYVNVETKYCRIATVADLEENNG